MTKSNLIYHDNLKNEYTKLGIQLSDIIQDLNKEVESMKKRGVNEEIINKKEFQVYALVDFYNACEKIINRYENTIQLMEINYRALQKLTENNEELRQNFMDNANI